MRVHWTDNALADLEGIQAHIGLRSPHYARAMVNRIFDRTTALADLPYLGAVVPEYEEEADSFREVFEHPYRIVYRVMTERVDIVTVVHGARRMPADL